MKLRKRRRCSVTQGSGERSDSPLNGWPAEPQSPDDAAAAAAAASEDDEDERQGTSMVSSLSRLWSRASKRPQVRASASSRSSVTRPASVSSGVSQPSLVDIAIPPRPSTAGSGSQPAKRTLTLLPSVFAGRPPVVLFTYTTACGAKQRPLGRGVTVDDEALRLFYSHTDSVHQYNAVINVLRQGGLYRVKQETKRWHVLWSTHPSPDQLKCFGPLQRANHFPGSFHLGRKDLLWRNIARMQRLYGKPYQITPQGYILPKAFPAWDLARARQPDSLWIWKPCSQSCGRGIKVLSSNLTKEQERDLARKRGIIQRYVRNPLLIDGCKFDMRIYVVVLSYDPLKVYINDEGLVRFATEKYSTSPESLESRMMHLTNYSVNRYSPAFIQNKDGKADEEDGEGENDEDGEPRAHKWSLSELRQHFEKEKLSYDGMWKGIKDVVIKTLIAAEQPLQAEWGKNLDDEDQGWAAQGPAGAHRFSCFEIYGFDVLVDSDLKAWLLEVNICPSLSSGSPLDKRIKTKLVADTMSLVGVQPPASLWQKVRGSFVGEPGDSMEEFDGLPGCCLLTAEELAKRAKKLASFKTPADAVAHFDDEAWDLVLRSHDEDMRCGGLERCFPGPDSAKYVEFLESESYCNMVLRRWHEAGGAEIFKAPGRIKLPPWVPKKVCFEHT